VQKNCFLWEIITVLELFKHTSPAKTVEGEFLNKHFNGYLFKKTFPGVFNSFGLQRRVPNVKKLPNYFEFKHDGVKSILSCSKHVHMILMSIPNKL
jgi:hypothetical protein